MKFVLQTLLSISFFIAFTYLIFSIVSLDYENIIQFTIVVIILFIPFVLSGGIQRIIVSSKVNNLLKKLPKNTFRFDLKEAAKILNTTIYVLKNYKLKDVKLTAIPKKYRYSINLEDKNNLTKNEIKTFAYLIFSDLIDFKDK
ncbi:MAG: hypothetical protein KKH98_06895 [Spirochaetes bacterium]|nr:hypothetical protein [Spirochaetota bacterium]